MQTNTRRNFADEGQVFYINGMQAHTSRTFTDEEKRLYIKDMQTNRWKNFRINQWYVNKQVGKFYW